MAWPQLVNDILSNIKTGSEFRSFHEIKKRIHIHEVDISFGLIGLVTGTWYIHNICDHIDPKPNASASVIIMFMILLFHWWVQYVQWDAIRNFCGAI